jgi:hypothetical protein
VTTGNWGPKLQGSNKVTLNHGCAPRRDSCVRSTSAQASRLLARSASRNVGRMCRSRQHGRPISPQWSVRARADLSLEIRGPWHRIRRPLAQKASGQSRSAASGHALTPSRPLRRSIMLHAPLSFFRTRWKLSLACCGWPCLRRCIKLPHWPSQTCSGAGQASRDTQPASHSTLPPKRSEIFIQD